MLHVTVHNGLCALSRLSLAMSTPPNNEKSPRKWIKQKFSSVFSSSRNLDVPDAQSTSNSFLAAQAREKSPRIIADRTGSGKKISFIHNPRV